MGVSDGQSLLVQVQWVSPGITGDQVGQRHNRSWRTGHRECLEKEGLDTMGKGVEVTMSDWERQTGEVGS